MLLQQNMSILFKVKGISEQFASYVYISNLEMKAIIFAYLNWPPNKRYFEQLLSRGLIWLCIKNDVNRSR